MRKLCAALVPVLLLTLGLCAAPAQNHMVRVPGAEGNLYGVVAVKLLQPTGNQPPGPQPCYAQLGDEIEVWVKNLDLWLRDVLTEQGAPPDASLQFGKLIEAHNGEFCLILNGQPMRSVQPSSWVHRDYQADEKTQKDQRRAELLDEKKQVEDRKGKLDPNLDQNPDEKARAAAKAEFAALTAKIQAIDAEMLALDATRQIPAEDYLRFVLARSEGNAQSKADWEGPLRAPGRSPRMELSVGLMTKDRITAVPTFILRDPAAKPEQEFHLRRIPGSFWMVAGILIIGAAMVMAIHLARTTELLREPTGVVRLDGLPGYSLGRCQMAFWFFLVASSFLFLWLVTGRGDLDTINSSTLGLIGISAGTALGAAFLSGRGAGSDNVATATTEIPYPERIRLARAALAQINGAMRVLSATDSAGRSALALQRDAAERALNTRVEDFRNYRRLNRGQFLNDLLQEGGVVSFHRFQIVVWTLVLGIVFLSGVLTKLAMPEFDSTLLLLMGLSSGTYLGFKLPDTRPSGARPPADAAAGAPTATAPAAPGAQGP